MISIRLDHYFHGTNDPAILAVLTQLVKKVDDMANELATLTQEVADTEGTVASAIVLIQGFKAALDAAIAAGNPQALTDLSARLDKSQQDLAEAVAANPLPPP